MMGGMNVDSKEKNRRLRFMTDYFRAHVYASLNTIAWHYNREFDTELKGQSFIQVSKILVNAGIIEKYSQKKSNSIYRSKIFDEKAHEKAIELEGI